MNGCPTASIPKSIPEQSIQLLPKATFPIERLLCPALRQHPHGQAVARILAAALSAVEPASAVHRHLSRTGNDIQIGENTLHLDQIRQIRLVGFGKASLPMGHAAAEILGSRLHSGVLITKQGQASLFNKKLGSRFSILESAHPIPDQTSLSASHNVIASLKGLTSEDLVICLISGGGSALLTAPQEGISLDDLQTLTSLLLACGASIFEINILRKHLEQLKGGGLARLVAPAQLAALVLSDVIGDPLDVIASGPAVPDPSTFTDALKILESYRLLDKTPPSILNRLHLGVQGKLPETPKPGEAIFTQTSTLIIGSNRLAAQAAVAQARLEGMESALVTTYLQGEASQAGRFIAALGKELAFGDGIVKPPCCLVFGGETTVTLHGEGLGGRNQELALGALTDLAGLEDIMLVTLATDGGDGPTDAAGAVVSTAIMKAAQQLHLDPLDFLSRNDSYHFFQPLGALLQSGPTQTNVNDLAFFFAF